MQVKHETRETHEHVGQETRRARKLVEQEARKSREHVEHEAREAREHLGHEARRAHKLADSDCRGNINFLIENIVSSVQNVCILTADKVLKKVRKCKTNNKVHKNK